MFGGLFHTSFVHSSFFVLHLTSHALPSTPIELHWAVLSTLTEHPTASSGQMSNFRGAVMDLTQAATVSRVVGVSKLQN